MIYDKIKMVWKQIEWVVGWVVGLKMKKLVKIEWVVVSIIFSLEGGIRMG